MMTATDRLLKDIVKVVVQAASPEKVILFGSRGRGDHHRESDVDLLIVQSEPFSGKRSRRKEMARLWRLLAPFPVSIDILLFSHGEVEFWRDSLNNVVAHALREGRVLYERPDAGASLVDYGRKGRQGVEVDAGQDGH